MVASLAFAFVLIAVRIIGGSKWHTLDGDAPWSSHLGGLGLAVTVFLEEVLHRLSIGQTTKTLALDLGLVNKDIATPIVRNDESISLQSVEPIRQTKDL